MSTKRDYYEVLGCSKDASSDDLRRAYKKEALKHHPDRNQGNADAERTFKEINEAYQVLSDENKRAIYDQFGHAGLDGSMGGGAGFDGGIGDVFAHMQDLFSEMFSGGVGGGFGRQQRRGSDLRVQVQLTLREAAFGAKREVPVHAPARCTDCSGTGAESGSKPETCHQCRGTGQVSSARGFVMFTSPCPKCQGQGVTIKNPCKGCGGHGVVERARKVMVTFPAGVDAGQRLRVPGQGMPGPPNAPSGDLYVEIDVQEHPAFERDGVNLITRVPVSFTKAALGGEVEVPSLEDDDTKIPVTLQPGTQPNATIHIKGKGVPRLDGRGRGSLVAVVQVMVPTALTGRAKELLTELESELQNAKS